MGAQALRELANRFTATAYPIEVVAAEVRAAADALQAEEERSAEETAALIKEMQDGLDGVRTELQTHQTAIKDAANLVGKLEADNADLRRQLQAATTKGERANDGN